MNQIDNMQPEREIEIEIQVRPSVVGKKCYFCGTPAHIYDEVFERYACIDCADVDHGGGHI